MNGVLPRTFLILFKKKLKTPFFNGEGIEVPKYLTNNKIDFNSILFTEYHIGYWLLDVKPPTKASTQPSNILKDEMFFPYTIILEKLDMKNFNFIMQKKQPDIVVIRKNRLPFDGREKEANQFMQKELQTHYKILDTVQAAVLYQRLPVK